MNTTFGPADILLPAGIRSTWPVIACDQYSSDKGYWAEIERQVGGDPSTLRMIIPEAYLGEIDVQREAAARSAAMAAYLEQGVFRTYRNAFVYVERQVTGEKLRRGLVGAIDLEAYEYTAGTQAPIRASENTIISRLPPRVQVRRSAPIELPHVMVLIDDAEKKFIESVAQYKYSMPMAYDLQLMGGGGHIAGWLVIGQQAQRLQEIWDTFAGRDVQIVIGDGNHSLAAAKAWWDELKTTLTPEQRRSHPARFALVEMNNVYDSGIEFEPIHRVVFDTQPERLLNALEAAAGAQSGRKLRWVSGGRQGEIALRGDSLGSFIAAFQETLDAYLAENAGTVDYIHDDSAALEFAKQDGAIAFIMPQMEKADLFKTVASNGVFPKKSFSIGHARDKRYYLECRRIAD